MSFRALPMQESSPTRRFPVSDFVAASVADGLDQTPVEPIAFQHANRRPVSNHGTFD